MKFFISARIDGPGWVVRIVAATAVVYEENHTLRVFGQPPSGVMRIIEEVDYAAVSVDPTGMCGREATTGCGVGRARWTFPHC